MPERHLVQALLAQRLQVDGQIFMHLRPLRPENLHVGVIGWRDPPGNLPWNFDAEVQMDERLKRTEANPLPGGTPAPASLHAWLTRGLGHFPLDLQQMLRNLGEGPRIRRGTVPKLLVREGL
jgi:hypothetical protein